MTELRVDSMEEVRRSIDRVVREFPKAMSEALFREAKEIKRQADPLTPFREGYLRRQNYVNEPVARPGAVEIGFGNRAEYGAAVHNIPEPPAKSEGGRSAHHVHGQWHFISDPVTNTEEGRTGRIADAIDALFQESIR